MADIARYSIMRRTHEDGSRSYIARERARGVGGERLFFAPSSAGWIVAPSREGLLTILRTKHRAGRIWKRRRQWLVAFDGKRGGGEEETKE